MWFIDWFKKQHHPPPPVEQNNLFRVLSLSLFLEDRLVLERLGRQYGWELHFATASEGFRLLSSGAFAVILLESNQRGDPWREVLDRLVQVSPGSCIFLVSPTSDDYMWGEVLQHGGDGVVTRPLGAEHVLHAIQAAASFVSPAAG